MEITNNVSMLILSFEWILVEVIFFVSDDEQF